MFVVGQVAEKLSDNFSDYAFKKQYKREKPIPVDEVIFMCKVGGRSQKALLLAQQLGYKK